KGTSTSEYRFLERTSSIHKRTFAVFDRLLSSRLTIMHISHEILELRVFEREYSPPLTSNRRRPKLTNDYELCTSQEANSGSSESSASRSRRFARCSRT